MGPPLYTITAFYKASIEFLLNYYKTLKKDGGYK